MEKEMEYIGETLGYHCYRNSDGFIEGYKHTGKVRMESKFTTNWDNVNRVVSITTDIEGFGKFILGKKKKHSFAPSNETQLKMFGENP